MVEEEEGGVSRRLVRPAADGDFVKSLQNYVMHLKKNYFLPPP